MSTQRPTKNVKTNRAFTLVEILVVIAITAVLFTLLLGPLINSFRLTQSAQMQVAAQDAARRTSEIISRELGTAAYVFGNTTHPFNAKPNTTDPTVPEIRFTNFLVLNIPKQDPATGALSPTGALGAAFNAKLDFVLPRHNSSGALTDPTTGSPIYNGQNQITGYSGDSVTVKNGAAAPTGLTFPLAPGTSMIRYFIGLRQPFKGNPVQANPYATQGEGSILAGNGNNTYVLYRAQFTPYTTTTANGTTTTAVNTDLFTTTTNSTGTVTPEFDDPDFFRIVAPGDPNWLDAAHAGYTPAQAGAHNVRVQKWFQIAKPVISSPNIDLILLPHGPDNKLAYDPAAGRFPGVAHSGAVHDALTGTDWPVVNTSVTFKFASVAADATASTTSDYAGQGVGANVADANSGLPYVPTVYTATDQSWANPYHLSLYQFNNMAGPLYDTIVADTTNTAQMYNAGDLLEVYNGSGAGIPVYNVTTGSSLPGAKGNYVPLTVAPDTATINFGLPALPTPGNPYQRYFYVTTRDIVNNAPGGVIDLSKLTDSTGQMTPTSNVAVSPVVTSTSPTFVSPLPPTDGSTLSGNQITNARIVPGSVRVYGPDTYPGPNFGQAVLYSAVYPGDAVGPQDNQYEMDYAHNAIRLHVGDLEANPAIAAQDSGTTTPLPAIAIAFDYQANLAPAYVQGSPSLTVAAGTTAYPLQVKVDYQTRDLLDINMGVRVYDPSNVGPAQVVTVHNQVRIGNSNR